MGRKSTKVEDLVRRIEELERAVEEIRSRAGTADRDPHAMARMAASAVQHYHRTGKLPKMTVGSSTDAGILSGAIFEMMPVCTADLDIEIDANLEACKCKREG